MRNEMKKLANIVADGEDRVLRILFDHAQARGYTKYSSTLEEAWRMSVRVLSATLINACKLWDGPPELSPDDDYLNDPTTQFGIVEAVRHRERGISIEMFLGLLKYYRQSYLDLVSEAGFANQEQEHCRRFVNRFFDRIELGLCKEWVGTGPSQRLEELQAANRQMTNEKNKYLTVFESLPNPAILLNGTLRIENLNHAAMEMIQGTNVPGSQYYCAQRDRLMEARQDDGTGPGGTGRSIETVLPWLAPQVTAFVRSGEAFGNLDVIWDRKDAPRTFEVCLSRMLDVSKKFEGLVVVLQDITARRHAENEKMRLMRQLEQSRKAESLGRLAGAVAHHFNNILMAVMGNLELAMDELAEGTNPRAPIDQAMASSRRAVEMSRLMLAYLGQHHGTMAAVDLCRLCRELLAHRRRELPQALSLSAELPEGELTIWADAAQMGQVLDSLITNAAEAMANESGRITVTLALVRADGVPLLRLHPAGWEPGQGTVICLTVRDTGGGMDPETMERLFDPFFSTKFTGRGLGLAVALGILKAHDGAIAVDSRLGRGTTVRVFFKILTRSHAPQTR